MKILIGLLLILPAIAFSPIAHNEQVKIQHVEILSHTVDPKEGKLKMYWKDDSGVILKNFQNLKNHLYKSGEKLVFAMNAGMYQKDHSPQGLFIDNGEVIKNTNRVQKAYGNFYLQPNGIFYLTTSNIGHVIKTSDFKINEKVNYATQSGPMLVIDGNLHPAFKDGSQNIHIRNGVGILPDGKILFAMSKDKINLFDFATYFKNKGCKNALYLDGFVSRTYLPEQKWEQLDGQFGVLIGETD